ncbi:MAG TPA: hypothetical protein DCP38_02650 [Acidobacteria bacterium]|nr:hypothetical protein [Acidobacteriota bacterium]HAK54374.1 hypothetical protein [Acidobacteriota bacterium]
MAAPGLSEEPMRSTLLLVAAAIALGAYAYFVESDRPTRADAETAKDNLFDVDSLDLVELEVRAGRDRTVLRKTDSAWNLVEPIQTGADQVEVSGITTGVASLEIERVVTEAAEDLEPFGLADPRVEIAFRTEGDATLTRLRLGNDTPTGGDMYASRADDPRVYLVASYLIDGFNRSTFDLRDKSILHFVRDDVDRLGLSTPTTTASLSRTDDDWRFEAPWEARSDAGAVDALLTRLDTARMQTLVESENATLESYGLAEPRATIEIGAGSTTASLLIGGEADDGGVYARDLSRPLVFTVDASLADDLLRPPEAYRRTELLTLGPLTSRRLEIARNDARLVLAKSADDPAVWQRLEPAPGDVDQPTVTDLLTALIGLRADRFVEETDQAGFGLSGTVVTTSDGEREERVAFSRDGDTVYAVTEEDTGAAVVDAASFEAALAHVAALTGTGADATVP